MRRWTIHRASDGTLMMISHGEIRIRTDSIAQNDEEFVLFYLDKPVAYLKKNETILEEMDI